MRTASAEYVYSRDTQSEALTCRSKMNNWQIERRDVKRRFPSREICGNGTNH